MMKAIQKRVCFNMMKCKGCGALLQNEEPAKVGYVSKPGQEYCQRCFRLSHYGDISSLHTEAVNDEIVKEIYGKYDHPLFVLIVDVLDALYLYEDDLLSIFKGRDVLLLINKIDLLPSNIKDDRFERLFAKIVSKCTSKGAKIVDCLLTYKDDYTFNDFFLRTLDALGYQNIVFAGRANAGKSTLLNKLLGMKNLTTSIYPGTTISDNVFAYGKYQFIDTPGLSDGNSLLSYLPEDKIKPLMIDRTITPMVYQFYEPQTYLLDGIFKIDVMPEKNASIIFYINNSLKIHRTRTANVKRYLDNNKDSFLLDLSPKKTSEDRITNRKMYYLKGLGLFKIAGRCKIRISYYEKLRLFTNEVLL